MNIALISGYLNTYPGRDKFLRTLSYVAKLGTLGTSSKETEAKFKLVSSQMSSCRMILRLLDDIPMIHYAMTYGWGKQEPDWLIRWAELLQIAMDTIYYPIEHIYWAGEQKLIKIDTDAWGNATTWFWICSLNLSLLKIVRNLSQTEKQKSHLGGSNYNASESQKAVNKQRRKEILTCVRLILDISYAVSYLPSGYLWGGRFKTWHVGALGSLSSAIGLYQALSEEVAKKCS